jgi:hypothetical protein
MSGYPLVIPSDLQIRDTCTVVRTTSAIELLSTESGFAMMGSIVQLSRGAHLDVCGEGFDERTVKVHHQGKFYMVLQQDIGGINCN